MESPSSSVDSKKIVPDGDNPRSMILRAYRFVRKTERNPDGWTIEKAKERIKEHEASAATEAALRVDENICALADAPLGDSLGLLSCQEGKADTVRATGFMGSKYLMLGWIESQLPKGAETFLDAFSGGANVAYHFKRKRMKVIANDLLRFPYHLAKAVVENSDEKLTDEDVRGYSPPTRTPAPSSSINSTAITTPSRCSVCRIRREPISRSFTDIRKTWLSPRSGVP